MSAGSPEADLRSAATKVESSTALAVVGDRLLTDLADVTSDLAALEGRGTWAVVIPFEGAPVCARFSSVRPAVPWRYHTCYETPDLAATLADIEKSGLRCMTLSERKPAALFGGRHVSFYKIFGWGIIELLERE